MTIPPVEIYLVLVLSVNYWNSIAICGIVSQEIYIYMLGHVKRASIFGSEMSIFTEHSPTMDKFLGTLRE